MTAPPVKRINLALQGGGAHGAFTWGVLETLLADPGIEIAAISGTSAGALNAAALKAGMITGGRAGAIANLEWLWHEVGAVTDPRASDWLTALAPGQRDDCQGAGIFPDLYRDGHHRRIPVALCAGSIDAKPAAQNRGKVRL